MDRSAFWNCKYKTSDFVKYRNSRLYVHFYLDIQQRTYTRDQNSWIKMRKKEEKKKWRKEEYSHAFTGDRIRISLAPLQTHRVPCSNCLMGVCTWAQRCRARRCGGLVCRDSAPQTSPASRWPTVPAVSFLPNLMDWQINTKQKRAKCVSSIACGQTACQNLHLPICLCSWQRKYLQYRRVQSVSKIGDNVTHCLR